MKIVTTKDGSATVLHEKFEEHYHSIHGALQESKHVFIEYGLNQIQDKKTITVFEMGLGTGLNALLAFDYAKQNNLEIHYYSIEAYPISIEDSKLLAYDKLIEDTTAFAKIQEAKWEELVPISPFFELYKIKEFVENYPLDTLPKVDVVFYDAFAPNAQDHLWEVEILQKMFDLLIVGGHLTTYCAKGQFKRNLKQIGFEVKAVPGPPGKREMTLGYKL